VDERLEKEEMLAAAAFQEQQLMQYQFGMGEGAGYDYDPQAMYGNDAAMMAMMGEASVPYDMPGTGMNQFASIIGNDDRGSAWEAMQLPDSVHDWNKEHVRDWIATVDGMCCFYTLENN